MLVSVNKNIIPFFSIVITNFNRGYIIENAINSLLLQSCDDWECIIVDDGSSDNSYQIIKKYCDNDRRFKYIYHSNRGQAQSKNVGILAASGIYVTFLDSDDDYQISHLAARQKILFQNPDIELLHGGVNIIGEQFVPDRDNSDKLIHLNDCVIGGTFVIQKYSAMNIGGYPDVKYGDDTALFDIAIEKNLVIAKIDYPTYNYNRNSFDSLCNNLK